MKLIPLPAFQDDYPWFLHDGHRALGAHPGDAQPVMASLQRESLKLQAILVTRHRPDPIAGVYALREATGPAVYGPAHERLSAPFTRPVEGLDFRVIDRASPTAGHIACQATRVCGTHECTSGKLDAEPGNLELIHDARRCEESHSHALRQ